VSLVLVSFVLFRSRSFRSSKLWAVEQMGSGSEFLLVEKVHTSTKRS